MIDLHPMQCACADCRNRRLIRDPDSAAEAYRAAEPVPPSPVPKGEERGRDHGRAHRNQGVRPIEVRPT